MARFIFLRLFVLCFFISLGVQAKSDVESLAYLNTIRVHAGMTVLKNNNILAKAASSHAKYLISNQVHGHYQKSNAYYFTGETPAKRVIKAGYPSRYIMENLSINPQNEKKSIDNLFSAIYHRFVFLDFDKDEIGIGSFKSKKKRRQHSAYVYNLGSSGVSKLCSKDYMIKSGKYYMQELCKDKEALIPKILFSNSRDSIRGKNADVILYPYEGQSQIWPAFYRESPDPLPYYDVSGFPISVQFNPLHYKDITLHSFKLFDAKGNEIKNTKILQQSNDHNGLFTPLQFALMPLKRLEFSSKYTAEFYAMADGKKIKKMWSFTTDGFQKKLYKITKSHTKVLLKQGEEVVIYIVPTSKKNVVNSYQMRGKIDIEFLDQNTLKIKAPNKVTSQDIILDFGRRKVSFSVR